MQKTLASYTLQDNDRLNKRKAQEFLEASRWNIEQAAASFFAVQEEAGAASDNEADEPPPSQGGPSSSATAPVAGASSSAARKPAQQKKKFSSLRDLQKSEEAGDDDDSEKEQEYFAGGDKSGLAVQDPTGPPSANDHIQRLLNTARSNQPRPPSPEAAPAPRPTAFTGTGMTLGGDDLPSRAVPTAGGNAPRRPPAMVERTLHLWNDGFSVDDGPLYRYDDPANARTLDMINRGSAPLDLMGVEAGQAVDVKLETHRGEDYVRPKKKYRPFEGSGQRLGAEVPNAPTSSTSSATVAVPTASTAAAQTPAAAPAPAKPAVDESQPSVTLQIRLADGTRLPSRFNTSATVGDVYDFVAAANAGSSAREYTLATTFPTKDLDDRAAKLGDMPEFKRGGVVVQKWK